MTDTAELVDLDPYTHLSNAELAETVAVWPDGSEDQNNALAALRARAPGIGHNRPPLAEALNDEIEPFVRRAAEVIELAGKAVIIDIDSARSVADLGVKCKDLEAQIDVARLARSKPYRDAVGLINRVFGDVAEQLKRAREGNDGRGGLRGMVTAWDNKQRAAAAAEERRLREEQRRREEAAAEAERKAREAAETGKSALNAELAAAKAREEADQAARRANAVRPEPLRSHLGQVRRTRRSKFEIEDLAKVIAWLIEHPGHRSNVEQAVRTIIGAYLTAIGIDTVARGIEIPGVKCWVELGEASVRR
jgi:hypothetical protein